MKFLQGRHHKKSTDSIFASEASQRAYYRANLSLASLGCSHAIGETRFPTENGLKA